MTTDGDRYVVQPRGLMRLVSTILGRSGTALFIVDAAGIHWPGRDGRTEFALQWDEVTEIIRQRYLGSWYLFVVVKDVDAVVARHPMGTVSRAVGRLAEQLGPSPFSIPAQYAPLDEIIAQIRRFSSVPVRAAS